MLFRHRPFHKAICLLWNKKCTGMIERDALNCACFFLFLFSVFFFCNKIGLFFLCYLLAKPLFVNRQRRNRLHNALKHYHSAGSSMWTVQRSESLHPLWHHCRFIINQERSLKSRKLSQGPFTRSNR